MSATEENQPSQSYLRMIDIRTAQALGWTLYQTPSGYKLREPDGHSWNELIDSNATEPWEQMAPRYTGDAARILEMLRWLRERVRVEIVDEGVRTSPKDREDWTVFPVYRGWIGLSACYSVKYISDQGKEFSDASIRRLEIRAAKGVGWTLGDDYLIQPNGERAPSLVTAHAIDPWERMTPVYSQAEDGFDLLDLLRTIVRVEIRPDGVATSPHEQDNWTIFKAPLNIAVCRAAAALYKGE